VHLDYPHERAALRCPPAQPAQHRFIQAKTRGGLDQARAQEALQIGIPLAVFALPLKGRLRLNTYGIAEAMP